MDVRRQRPSLLPGRPGEKHGWISFDRYEAIHRGALERHRFVVSNETNFGPFVDPLTQTEAIALSGVVYCQADLEVEVRKLLAIRLRRRRREVRAYFYVYNAYIPLRGSVLRYDNAHRRAPDEHHRHEFDVVTGRQVSRTLLTREQFPTLIEVIAELEAIARRAGLV